MAMPFRIEHVFDSDFDTRGVPEPF